MSIHSALLLIDLQNEFLSPTGRFPINDSCKSTLETTIPALVHAFRSTGGPIFWIRSEYDLPTDSDGDVHLGAADTADEGRYSFLSGTHSGRNPCCEKGSLGAEFPEHIVSLINEEQDDIHSTHDGTRSENHVLTKTWFSSFKETTLQHDLQSSGFSHLFIGGLVTNVCVLATTTDALRLGFSVTVLENCLGWRKWGSHHKGLERCRELGAQVTSSNEAFSIATPVPSIPVLYYVNGSIPSWRVMMALYEKEVQFEARRLKVMSRPKETRLPAFLALNHRGKTPVFVDPIPSTPGDASSSASAVTINESLAILFYIETYLNADKPLLPPVPERAARALVLARIQETENLHHIYDALEDAHFEADNAGGALDDCERSRLVADVHAELDFWEVYAAKTKFIAGEVLTLADCAFFPILAYMVHRGFKWKRPVRTPTSDGGDGSTVSVWKSAPEEVDSWPKLKAYFQRVWSRNGEDGCAQRAQPEGWYRTGKANVWRGKQIYEK